MYTLLIADDEPLIRNGVKNIIDWESLGFSEIFLAEDGKEALEIVRGHKVDLVLTDIAMPFMDGLELSEALKKEFPEVHVVILTGYEDFEYAQQAVDLGVKNYILKPVGAETLYNKMTQICEKLHLENTKKQYISSMKSQLRQSLPVLQEQMLNRIVCNPGDYVEQYLKRCKGMEIELGQGPFEVAAMDMDLNQLPVEDLDLYLFAAKNITRECLGQEHYLLEDGRDRLVILFRCCFLGEDAHDIIYQTLCVIQKAIYNTIKIRATCAAGTEVLRADELNVSYKSARKALECKYSLGTDNVYDIGDLDYLQKSFYYPKKEAKNLLNSIKIGSEEEIRQAVRGILSAGSMGKPLSGINIKMNYIEAVTSLLRELSELKEVSEEIWNAGFSYYQAVNRLANQEEMERNLFAFSCRIRNELKSLQTNSSKQVIEKVKGFVERNYREAELTLSAAADFACVSTGYLSGLFKKETGTNFVKYLTDVRMEKSMELLRTTDMKTYEIAYETGFANPHYFSISFKKYTGMSPSEFRAKE